MDAIRKHIQHQNQLQSSTDTNHKTNRRTDTANRQNTGTQHTTSNTKITDTHRKTDRQADAVNHKKQSHKHTDNGSWKPQFYTPTLANENINKLQWGIIYSEDKVHELQKNEDITIMEGRRQNPMQTHPRH